MKPIKKTNIMNRKYSKDSKNPKMFKKLLKIFKIIIKVVR